jgi:malonyl-CoA/methylmalonyl-CoA synthetase
MPNSLFQSVRDRCASLGQNVWLETALGDRWTFADMVAESARFAAALVGLGIAPRDRIAVQVEKSAQALLLYLGAIRAGAIFLPLNTAYTPAEIEYFLKDAAPTLFVCDPARRDALLPVAAGAGVQAVATLGADGTGTLMDRLPASPVDFDDIDRTSTDLAAILYTSGTTGRSKGAMLTHGNLVSNAEVLVESWRFTHEDVLLHALPIYHTHGLFVAVNVMLFCGGAMLFLPKFDTDECLAHLPRASTMMGVPTFYTRLLHHPGLTRESTAHIRLFISGSAPLLEETHRTFEARTGHAILERYGMTETNMMTSNPYDGERIAGTVGLPLPGISIRIADPVSGQDLGAEKIGIVEVAGPNVFKGYWRNPEKTAAEFRADNYFITGDLGKIDARGYLRLVGRAKDLIITGGLNVYPKEIETEIDALPGIVETAVIGVPHEDFGEAIVAVVVRSDANVGETNILEALEKRLAKFKQPKRVVFVAELPRNAMGKVQKAGLRETYTELFTSGRTH